MFRRVDDFLASFEGEAARTLEVLGAVPDSAMGVQVAEGHRDLRRMAWHLVESLLEMGGRMGLALPGAARLEGGFIGEPPATMEEVARTYREVSQAFGKAVGAWSDPDLEREDDLYGETWKRGFTLYALLAHQTHHRGQMTVLLRQAGLPMPSIYGPAKEGWAAYGLPAPRV
jgi:uncharacterized damage-inducible protein DinB